MRAPTKFRHKLICLVALALSDLAALFTAFLLGFIVRADLLAGLKPLRGRVVSLSAQLSSSFLYGAFLVLLIFALEKLFTRRLFFWEETRLLIKSISLTFILVMTMVFVSRSEGRSSRAVIVLAWLFSLALFPFFRLAVKRILNRAGLRRKNILIIGTGRAAQRVAAEILKDDGLGYRVAGYLSEEGGNVGERLAGGFAVIGTIADLERLAARSRARDIVIALSDRLQHRLVQITKQCEPFAESIKIVPPVGNLFTIGVHVEHLGDVIALSVPRNLSKPWNLAAKRALELAATGPLFLLLLPLFALVSAAILADSRGPLIYSQWRLGRSGGKFRIFKFRSMFADGEARLERALERNPGLRAEWEAYQKVRGRDPRVTRVGRFLRKWSLDELPQLVNVLRGDMSLVGPRPYMPREADRIGPLSELLSRVKPGITGLWQVRGRNTLTFEDRLLLDEYYIRNWSPWLDIVILLKTVTALAKREGAF